MPFNHTTQEAFDAAHAYISTQGKERDHVIEFKEEWHNGTGYFDGLATEQTGLPIGHRFATCTTGDFPRKIVGIVTPVGNVVFFERYSDESSDVICVNTPNCLSALVPAGRQDQQVFERTIGAVQGFNMNLGQTLRSVILEVVGNAEKLNELKASRKTAAQDSEI